jgi:hypothetical protein
MSILFRTKKWLTIAQLTRAWSAELAGAEGDRDPRQLEQDLGHLLLEDIVNKRLDDAGPLAEGRRLGLRVIAPDGPAGFLEGHQVRDRILPGGDVSFVLHWIVVMKEAALDFARRHELPPPSWWTDAFAASTKPANHLAPDGTIPIPYAASKSPVKAGLGRTRGAKPKKLEQVILSKASRSILPRHDSGHWPGLCQEIPPRLRGEGVRRHRGRAPTACEKWVAWPQSGSGLGSPHGQKIGPRSNSLFGRENSLFGKNNSLFRQKNSLFHCVGNFAASD